MFNDNLNSVCKNNIIIDYLRLLECIAACKKHIDKVGWDMITNLHEGMKVEIINDRRLKNIVSIQLIPDGIAHSMTLDKANALSSLIQDAVYQYHKNNVTPDNS